MSSPSASIFRPTKRPGACRTVLFAGYIGMATGGWLAGVMFDRFGFYLPAFAVGLVFNVVNLMILLWLVTRERNDQQLVSAGVAAVA